MENGISKSQAIKYIDNYFNKIEGTMRPISQVRAEVKRAVYAIDTHDHKVILPNEVGNQWDNVVSKYTTNLQGSEIDLALLDIIKSFPNQDTRNIRFWMSNTRNACAKLIDAARYGWIPEKEVTDKEKRWNVFVPAAIKIPGHVSLYGKFKNGVQPVNTDGPINAGEYNFTLEELVKYGLNGPMYEKQVVKDGKQRQNENPKRYVLPMPYGADDDDPERCCYAAVNREYHAGPSWFQGPCVSFKEAQKDYSVTRAEIDAAPDWVKSINPIEVTDDEQ